MPRKDEIIKQLQTELSQYKQLGTVKEMRDYQQYKYGSPLHLSFCKSHINKAQTLENIAEPSLGAYLIAIFRLDGTYLVEPFMCRGGLTRATKDALTQQIDYSGSRDFDLVNSFTNSLNRV